MVKEKEIKGRKMVEKSVVNFYKEGIFHGKGCYWTNSGVYKSGHMTQSPRLVSQHFRSKNNAIV